MDFGLWVEPEMVSPDSALYRAHPDWCLHEAGHNRPTQRHQLVLDLTRAEVAEHVFVALDSLLRAHAIAYLKWDHNRPLFPRAGKAHAQASAVHALLDRLRAAHPSVEIESCASGGGRIDHATLRRTHRVWPSDNNDPHDRARIDFAWSLFLPPEVRGLHVGPSPNPITGRCTPMDLRAKLALFGHMGVEANPADFTAAERKLLTEVIALYKEWRELLHSGTEREIARGPGGLGRMVLAADGSRALALVIQLASPADYNAEPVRLTGLMADRRYRVTLPKPWPRRGGILPNAASWRDGLVLSGRALAAGINLPLQAPETGWLIAMEALDS
jgi:alpha-galactosidase